MKVDGFKEEDFTLDNLKEEDKWILTKLNETIKAVRKSMDKYDFNIAGATLYDFIWSDFCDKYIELSKFYDDNTTKSVLVKVLTDILKMLHPFMPYVTEEIYGKLPIREAESIMISKYPEYNKKEVFTTNIDKVLEFITMFRNKKAELGIGSDYKVIVKIEEESARRIVINMLKLSDKMAEDEETGNIEVKYEGLEVDIVYDNSKNLEEEKEKLLKERESLESSIMRREKLLANENYVMKAPKEIVDKERESLEKERNLLKDILSRL